jgi:hypothetical protein
MTVIATFHGPNYDSLVNDEYNIEVFDSLGHAMSALFDRYDSGGARALPVYYLNGFKDTTYFPMVTGGHYLCCYLIPEDSGSSHEGVILEALTAVHGGVWDYRLVLIGDRPDGTVSVSVEKR